MWLYDAAGVGTQLNVDQDVVLTLTQMPHTWNSKSALFGGRGECSLPTLLLCVTCGMQLKLALNCWNKMRVQVQATAVWRSAYSNLSQPAVFNSTRSGSFANWWHLPVQGKSG